MPIALSAISLLRPASLPEALEMMDADRSLVPLAGCTDLYVGLQADGPGGRPEPRRFIDLWPLDDLRGISRRGDVVHLGALTTYSEIIASALVQRRLPMLVSAAREIGGRQVQHRGTIGGNIANASPAGDTLPVLSVCEGQVVLRDAEGERRVPFRDFYTGYRTTVRRPNEIIVGVDIPPVDGQQYWRKVGTRRAQAISKVMCAAVRGDQIRVAFGAVAPTVVRAARAEAVLMRSANIEQAMQALSEDIAPIDDLRSTAEYRRRVSANLLADFWKTTS